MFVKELIFSETAGLQPKTLEKRSFFWKCLFQGTSSRLAVSHLRSSSRGHVQKYGAIFWFVEIS